MEHLSCPQVGRAWCWEPRVLLHAGLWLQGVAAWDNRAGLLTDNVPPTSLLEWVSSGSGDIPGQRFTN